MATNIIKGKFLKDGEPMGREYSYLTDIVVNVGNVFTVNTDRGEAQLVCTAINVPEEEIASFKDKMKNIKEVVAQTLEEYNEPLFC